MLKFIDENDFDLVDEFTENEDGSVSWIYDDGVSVHSGLIRNGFKRQIQVQTGTELVVTGKDENGDDVTEEQPVFETQEIDVWQTLHSLNADPSSPVTIQKLSQSTKDAIAKEQQRQALKAQRETALNEMVHDFGDGRVVQVRPSDLINFQTAIATGIDRDWILADNSIATLTVADMQTAMQSGIAQATQIFDDHIAALAALSAA